jgi:hypothetical protein
VDHELLVRADVCPQSHNKANRLLDELISGDDPVLARTRPSAAASSTTATTSSDSNRQRRSSSSVGGGGGTTSGRSRTSTAGGTSSISTDDIIDDTTSNRRYSHSNNGDTGNSGGSGSDDGITLTITPLLSLEPNDDRSVTLEIALIPRRVSSRTTSSSSSSLLLTPCESPKNTSVSVAQFGPELLSSTWRRGASKNDSTHNGRHPTNTSISATHDDKDDHTGNLSSDSMSDLDVLAMSHGKNDDEHSTADAIGEAPQHLLNSHNNSPGDSPLLPPVASNPRTTSTSSNSSTILLSSPSLSSDTKAQQSSNGAASPTSDPLLLRGGVIPYHQRVPSNGSNNGAPSASSTPFTNNNNSSPSATSSVGDTKSSLEGQAQLEVKATEAAMFGAQSGIAADGTVVPTYSAELVPILLSILKRQVTYRLVTVMHHSFIPFD